MVDNQEAIAGAFESETEIAFPDQRPELLTGGATTDVTKDDMTDSPPMRIDNGNQRLSAVVFEHEFGGGCGTAP